VHIQFLSNAVASPQDVTLLIYRLAKGDVNLAAVGGGDVELGGKVAFAVADGDEQKVRDVMNEWHYQFEEVDARQDPRLKLCSVTDDPGSLYTCLRGVAEENLAAGRVIRHILVGVPRAAEEPGTIPVQVFSETVRTAGSATELPPFEEGGTAA
jgi:hypothetical protein